MRFIGFLVSQPWPSVLKVNQRWFDCEHECMRPSCDRVMFVQVFKVFWLPRELKRVDQFLINFFNRPILPFSGCFERLQLVFKERDGDWRMITEDYSTATEGHHSRIMSAVLKLHLFPPSHLHEGEFTKSYWSPNSTTDWWLHFRLRKNPACFQCEEKIFRWKIIRRLRVRLLRCIWSH